MMFRKQYMKYIDKRIKELYKIKQYNRECADLCEFYDSLFYFVRVTYTQMFINCIKKYKKENKFGLIVFNCIRFDDVMLDNFIKQINKYPKADEYKIFQKLISQIKDI